MRGRDRKQKHKSLAVLHAKARKRANRKARLARWKIEAAALGITLQTLQFKKWMEVQEILEETRRATLLAEQRALREMEKWRRRWGGY
ncbi:hypothetical protein GYA54_00210 [Candidatus Kuenenbacteria bacterium]|nr:hypothetical protein [Candidatus Kuenenbacteria bacterium]